jgi:hypothetical protein
MNDIPSDLPPQEKKRSPLLWGCGALVVLALLLVGTVAATLWWSQRPIRPVVLSAQEKAGVEKKIEEVGLGTVSLNPQQPPGRPAVVVPPSGSAADPRAYVPGSKTLKLTEREVNGLLNMNTDLGSRVRIEFARDAINAYLAIPIPEDFPIGAGTIFRMRGRFKVSIGGEGTPYAVLEDVTIFGLSLPKDWLGGIKGENLLGDALGGGAVVQGIKSLKVEPGALVLEVAD